MRKLFAILFIIGSFACNGNGPHSVVSDTTVTNKTEIAPQDSMPVVKPPITDSSSIVIPPPVNDSNIINTDPNRESR